MAYHEDMIGRRLAALAVPDDVRAMLRQALTWAWKDEEMHAIYVRGALLKLGRPLLRAATLARQAAGALGGWSASVGQHVRWRDAPLSRTAAALVTGTGILIGPRAPAGAQAPALRLLPLVLRLQRGGRAHGLAVLGPHVRAGAGGARDQRGPDRRVPPRRGRRGPAPPGVRGHRGRAHGPGHAGARPRCRDAGRAPGGGGRVLPAPAPPRRALRAQPAGQRRSRLDRAGIARGRQAGGVPRAAGAVAAARAALGSCARAGQAGLGAARGHQAHVHARLPAARPVDRHRSGAAGRAGAGPARGRLRRRGGRSSARTSTTTSTATARWPRWPAIWATTRRATASWTAPPSRSRTSTSAAWPSTRSAARGRKRTTASASPRCAATRWSSCTSRWPTSNGWAAAATSSCSSTARRTAKRPS